MQVDPKKLDAFLERAVTDLAAGYGGVMVSLGRRLGLYQAMAGAGPLSSQELARRTACAERYVREWLSSQAAGGYVVYHPASETFELTAEQAMVLADDASPVYMAPAWDVPASMWFDEDRTIETFRNGDGVPWGDHDHRLYRGVAAFYRNAYSGQLVQDWLPALDGVVERLETGITVADVGCGHGLSTAIMAKAFPRSRFVGYDTHADSVSAARENARREGVDDRTRFEISDARGYGGDGFDLICFFDCLHDMGEPVAAAAHARASLREGGSVMLVEPFAGDRLEENLNPVGRLFYSASTTLCCAHAISENGGAALGAQAGEARLASVFQKAGFGRFRRALATPFNLVLQAQA